jgi:hypothetical protein
VLCLHFGASAAGDMIEACVYIYIYIYIYVCRVGPVAAPVLPTVLSVYVLSSLCPEAETKERHCEFSKLVRVKADKG